ncbi:MAG: FHA domain-containing protein [Gammaproteobacteria bacterium]|nr:FHA domain-containing protein [Gammaproteobacteria bacterium]
MASIIQLVDGVVANRFEITETGLKFGRTSVNQVLIDDLAVSTEHAQINVLKDEQGVPKFVLQDLESTNGCFINEQKIDQQQLLRHKDVVRIGWNNFTFINEDEVDHEKTREVKKSWIPGVYYSKD